jgi:hypothetical protein
LFGARLSKLSVVIGPFIGGSLISPASVKEEEVQPQMQCSLLTALDSGCTGRIRPSRKYSVLDGTWLTPKKMKASEKRASFGWLAGACRQSVFCRSTHLQELSVVPG